MKTQACRRKYLYEAWSSQFTRYCLWKGPKGDLSPLPQGIGQLAAAAVAPVGDALVAYFWLKLMPIDLLLSPFEISFFNPFYFFYSFHQFFLCFLVRFSFGCLVRFPLQELLSALWFFGKVPTLPYR